MLFHCKSVNQQKTSIFALILWEEQRLNRFWSETRCWNSTFTFAPPPPPPKGVLSSIWAQLSYYLWRIHVEDPDDLTIAHAWPEVTSPEVTWLFPLRFSPVFCFHTFFSRTIFSRTFFQYFLLSSNTKMLVGGVLYDVRVL